MKSKLHVVLAVLVVCGLLLGLASLSFAQGPENPEPPAAAPFEPGEGFGFLGSRAEPSLSVQASGPPAPSSAVAPFDSPLTTPSGERPTTSTIGALSSTPASGLGIAAGANWLAQQQDVSGGWPWTPGGGVTGNTNGPTGRGELLVYPHDGDEEYLISAIATGDFLVPVYPRLYTDGDPRFATHDPLFLEELSIVTGDPTYADFVQVQFWDKLLAGTYGETNDQDALEFGLYVVNARDGQGIVELSPWDLSAIAIAAELAGETAIRDAIMAAIREGLEATVAPGGYDVIGLAGGIWASAVTGVNLDPMTGVYSTANSTADLVSVLLGMTLDASVGPWHDGAWLWTSVADPTDPANADAQTSAYALLALWAHDNAGHLLRITHGASFLRSLQDPATGQFLLWPGAPVNSTGSVEVNAEILTALTTVAPDQVWVDDDWTATAWGEDADGTGPGLSFGWDQFSIAQLGIDAVGQSTVYVAPGVYEEQLEVMKDNLELIGTGTSPDEVVILSPPSLPLFFTTSADNFPVVFIHGAENVRLQNLTVDGGGRGLGNYRFVGVAYFNSSSVVDNCRIIDIREEPPSGAQHGVGLMAYNSDGVPRDFSVNGTVISGHQKNGTVFHGEGLTVHVDGNEIVGFGPVSFIAENGIQISGGATGTVSGNTVTGHWYTGPSWASSCILPYNPGPGLLVNNNILDDCQAGIYGIGMSDPGMFENEVANSEWGLINYAGSDVEIGGNDLYNVNYGLYSGDGSGNRFEGNRVMGGEIGLSMDGAEGEPFILNNIFIGQTTDAMLFEPYETASPSDVEANLNAMCGWGSYGVQNTTANEILGTFNYWGHQPPVASGDYTGTVDVRYPIPLSLTGPSSVAVGQSVVYTASLATPYNLGISGYGIELQTTAGSMIQPTTATISPTGVVTGTWTAPTLAGPAIISAVPECGQTVTQSVTVQSGVPTTISITEPISGTAICQGQTITITGELLDSQGNPVIGHWIDFYASSGSFQSLGTLSAAEGQAVTAKATELAATEPFATVLKELGITPADAVGTSCQTGSNGRCSVLWIAGKPEANNQWWLLATAGEVFMDSPIWLVEGQDCPSVGIYLPIILKNK